MNTKALRKISYGLYIISTWDKGRPVGCTANSVMQITSSPATVMLSLNHDNYTNGCIKDCGYFGVSILSEETEPMLIGTFGYSSSKEVDKFKGVDYSVKGAVPIVNDTVGYLACKVTDKMETTTHTVFLGEIIDTDALKDDPVMTYQYYHEVIKGKSPKNAPTYIAEDEGNA